MTPGIMRGVPNTPGTPRRTIRIADALWQAAQAKAEERGENLSEVIRDALRRYVRSEPMSEKLSWRDRPRRIAQPCAGCGAVIIGTSLRNFDEARAEHYAQAHGVKGP